MNSYCAKPPVTGGSVSGSAFASSTESTFVRKITPHPARRGLAVGPRDIVIHGK
jgi:hypothetical protein